MLKPLLQKVNKEILKLIHMNWAVYVQFSEETQSLYMMNRLNLGFYSHLNIDQAQACLLDVQ